MILVVAVGSAWGQPTDSEDVVILARSQLRLGAAVRHLSGQIVVNDPGGQAIVNPQMRTVPDLAPQLVADVVSVPIQPYAGPVLFDLFVNTLIDPSGKHEVLGAMQQPIGAALPLLAYPEPVAVTTGAQNVIVKRTTSPLTLPPGDYGDIRVGAGGALFLEGGTYNVRSLRAAGRSLVLFNGTTTVNIAQRARFGMRSDVGPTDPTMSGRCVVLNFAGSSRLRFGRTADVNAIVNAPNATLVLGRLGVFRGRFTASRINVARGAVLQSLPSLTEACP